MTKIKFYKNQDKFVGFEFDGHTGYSESGEDILCATISGISQACLIGLMKVVRANPKYTRDENRGFLKIELPQNLGYDELNKSSLLIEVVYESIKDLCEGYSKYISMEVI